MCIAELDKYLTARGHYVKIIAPRPAADKTPQKIPKNIILLGRSTELNTPFHTKADINIARDIEAIDGMFAREQFDVVHFHEPGIPALSVQLLNRSPAANVGTMHSSLPEGMVAKSFQKLMAPFAQYIELRLDAVTAVSEAALETAMGYVQTEAHDVKIIPNGVDVARFRKPTKLSADIAQQIDPTKKIILSIGRLEKRKGPSYLLRAYHQLRSRRDDIQLLIVGEGHKRANLEQYIERHEVPDVAFLGFVSEDDKVALLHKADVYTSPALFGESFGIVLLEAMAAGCVTVAGDNPGYTAVMQETGKLSLVNPRDTRHFSERLEIMLFDEQVRKLWLKWASQYVEQFDFSHVVDQYEAIYRSVIKKPVKE